MGGKWIELGRNDGRVEAEGLLLRMDNNWVGLLLLLLVLCWFGIGTTATATTATGTGTGIATVIILMLYGKIGKWVSRAMGNQLR
jgi:hypothetical protein